MQIRGNPDDLYTWQHASGECLREPTDHVTTPGVLPGSWSSPVPSDNQVQSRGRPQDRPADSRGLEGPGGGNKRRFDQREQRILALLCEVGLHTTSDHGRGQNSVQSRPTKNPSAQNSVQSRPTKNPSAPAKTVPLHTGRTSHPSSPGAGILAVGGDPDLGGVSQKCFSQQNFPNSQGRRQIASVDLQCETNQSICQCSTVCDGHSDEGDAVPHSGQRVIGCLGTSTISS